ncbi:MAG: hypothetical protein C0621_08620 [Desulfuromonas sp.]|nr:MAG: hypothetical protein C0621_08620 [Desulfuromonas sp.]
MNGLELREQLATQRSPQHHFIRWFRRENDFADYETLDAFLDHLENRQEFAGYDLLDMDAMWHQVEVQATGRVHLEHRTKGDTVVWTHTDRDGFERTDEYPYTPESLMTIFDAETDGNTHA